MNSADYFQLNSVNFSIYKVWMWILVTENVLEVISDYFYYSSVIKVVLFVNMIDYK